MRGKREVQRSQEFIVLKISLVIGSVLFILMHYFMAYRRVVNK